METLDGTQKWPDALLLVRHGQSAGNIARDAAEAAGLPHIPIATRDVDVPLSPLGEQQAAALGRWLARLPDPERPTAALSSPYLRARETARIALDAGALAADVPLLIDERLREKEFGVFDRLTKYGAAEKFPDEAERRALLGKFYYRPPGGESWCDVILRLRSLVGTLARDYRRERVLIVGHQVVIHCFRYLLERLSEEQVLAIDAEKNLANCGVTRYAFDPALGKQGGPALRAFNFVAPLEEAGAPVTRKPDVPIAPK